MITSNLFVDALFWFFAIVGVFSLISEACSSIASHTRLKSKNTSIVMWTKNNQDTIEGELHNLIWRTSSKYNNNQDIVVVDLGSTDETKQILSYFEKNYDFIHVTDKEGYIKTINSMI